MLKQPLTESQSFAILRGRSVSAPTELLLRLARPSMRKMPWTLALSGSAAVAGAVLGMTFSLTPTLSLADVAKAQAYVKQFTIVNTRILNDGNRMIITRYSDGRRWSSTTQFLRRGGSSSRIVMNGRGLYRFRSVPNAPNYVFVDNPTPCPRQEFSINTILGGGGKATVERNVLWNGRRVDRFRLSKTYAGIHHLEPLDQEVIADPVSHLPLRVQVMRDHKAWGDIWEYNYEPVAQDKFAVVIPKGAKLFELPKDRTNLANRLGADANLLVDSASAHLLIREIKVRALRGDEVGIDTRRYRLSSPFQRLSLKDDVWQDRILSGNVDLKKLGKESSVTVTIGDSRFQKVPVFVEGDVQLVIQTNVYGAQR